MSHLDWLWFDLLRFNFHLVFFPQNLPLLNSHLYLAYLPFLSCLFVSSLKLLIIFAISFLNYLYRILSTSIPLYPLFWRVMNFWRTYVVFSYLLCFYVIYCISFGMNMSSSFIWGLLSEQSLRAQYPVALREEKTSYHKSDNIRTNQIIEYNKSQLKTTPHHQ
jgi:hypothetical protein